MSAEISEQELRANIQRWMVGRSDESRLPWTQKRFAFLLRLLDAERARAEAAEAAVADIRIAYVNWQSSDDTPELLDVCSRLAP